MVRLLDRSARDVPASAGRLMGAALAAALAELGPARTVVGDELRRRYRFADFAAAAAFAAAVAPLADAEDHHPELVVAWGRVDVRLSTHDVDGLSLRDAIVAAKLDALAAARGAVATRSSSS